MAHYVSNVSIKQRIAQIMVLMIFIFAGLLFSRPAEAGPRPLKYGKSVKTSSIVHRNSNQTCYLLHKKRTNYSPKKVMIASRHVKVKPMAETDTPGRIASSN